MVLLKSSTPQKPVTSLFEIRVKSSSHDVLVVKGSPHEANSVLLSGSIVLSVLEPISIKKLSLKLYATLRLKWTNSYQTSRGTKIKKPFRYERRVFEHVWDDFEIQSYLSNLYDNYGSAITSKSRNSSSASLKNLSYLHKKSKSSSNLTSFGSSTNLSSPSSNHILLEGNYEFPFSAVLPGTILESVEGLPGASVVYKLQATIDRGRFSSALVAKKHLRIVRTMTPDAVELSETLAVDNTWPEKVEYTISIPSRAIAIGSCCPIDMILIPLKKGLKLGKIKVYLVEYFSCTGSYGPSHTGERIIQEMSVPSAFQDSNDDRWEVNTSIQFPASLSKCTQDVDILENIKVRHRLKFDIGLINPDGHISELRASLPIILFISPFVAVGVKNYLVKSSRSAGSLSDLSDVGDDERNKRSNVNPNITNDSRKNKNNYNNNNNNDDDDDDDDDVIFAPDPEIVHLPGTLKQPSETVRTAPPNYENHIYDRLWNEIPIDNTPEESRTVTPAPGTPNGMNHGESLDANNVGRLTENLRRLHVQRLSQAQQQPSLDSLTLPSTSPLPPTSPQSLNTSSFQNLNSDAVSQNDENDDGALSFQTRPFAVSNSQPLFYAQTPTNDLGVSDQDYFSLNPYPNGLNNGAVVSPGVLSPGLYHISRANSETNLTGTSPPAASDWDFEKISKVPSYFTAMRSPTPDLLPESLPPEYDDSEMLPRPKSLHLKSSSLSNSRAQSTAYLSSLRSRPDQVQPIDMISRSKNSSQDSSPSISRNQSHSNILSSSYGNHINYSRSPNKSKLSANSSKTALSHSPPIRSNAVISNISTHSNSHSNTHVPLNRSGSFANLMGSLLHKKDTRDSKKH